MAKTLRKDTFHAITGSWPRFVSIAALMVLGVFALVGLKVTGPDMRNTAESLYRDAHLTDLTVTSSWGLEDADDQLIQNAAGVRDAEFGYAADTTLAGTDDSVRVFSTPERISLPQVVSGTLPTNSNEIALDYRLEGRYHIGDTVDLKEGEKTNDASSDDAPTSLLKNHEFKVVGFAKSAEYIDREELGPTTVGTGQLDYFGFAIPDTFDSDLHTIARLVFDDTNNAAPYDSSYLNALDAHKTEIKDAVSGRPDARLKDIKADKQSEIDDKRADIADAQSEIDSAQALLDSSATKLDEANAQLDQARQAGYPEAQLSAMAATIDEQQQTYDESKSELDSKKSELADKKSDLDKAQSELDSLEAPSYTVSDRRDFPGYEQFGDNATRIDVLSEVFPVFLFAIAALVSLTTMTRMVDEERITNGTLAALGYTPASIRRKYLIYGISASLLGSVIGVLLGHTLLPSVIFRAYAGHFVFPSLQLSFYPWISLIATLIAIACTVIAATIVATRELRQLPAVLLQPKPPAAGTRILLERIGWLWKRMSFTSKITARNLFRYKKRMFMTIFGVAGCVALLICAFGLRDSLAGIVTTQFDDILHYDVIAKQQDDASKSDRDNIDTTINGMSNVDKHLNVHNEQLTTHSGKDNAEQDISLLVDENPTTFENFITLRDRASGDALSPDKNGVIVSEKLANLLHLGIGDTMKLDDADGNERSFTIGALTEMYVGHYVIVDPTQYESAFGHAAEHNATLISLHNSSDDEVNAVSSKLMDQSGMEGIVQVDAITSTINSIMSGLNNVILVLIVASVLLALVVIFNLTNINVSERIRELSTIKVLGFYPMEVTLYIYRETIILTLLGILAGYAIGIPLHAFILQALPPDAVMFTPGLMWTNYALSAAITLLISGIVMVIMHVRLKRVDMLEALKSVE